MDFRTRLGLAIVWTAAAYLIMQGIWWIYAPAGLIAAGLLLAFIGTMFLFDDKRPSS